MTDKSFRIKYDVHCKLQNFFNKEMVVKHCMSEMHAKVKLNEFLKKKYGIEFCHIIISSCEEENDILSMFNDDIFKFKDKSTNPLTDKLFKDIFKKKQK